MRVLLFLLLITSGCSTTLHTARMENVKTFSASAKVLSLTPAELYHNISDFRHHLRLVESSTLFSADKIIPRLNQALVMKQAFEENTVKVESAFELIGVYLDGLTVIAGDEKNWSEKTADLPVKMNSVLKNYNTVFNKKIAAGTGNFLVSVISKFASMHLQQLQKKYLIEYINSGDVVVSDVCDYFTEEVSVELRTELNSLDVQFDNVMRNFYDNVEIYERKQNVSSFNYYKYYNPVYLGFKQTLIQLHVLLDETTVAMHKVKATHKKLLSSLKDNIADEFLLEVEDLYTTIAKIKLGYDNLKALDTSK